MQRITQSVLMNQIIYEMNLILKCAGIRSQVFKATILSSNELNVSNCVEKPENFRTSTGFAMPLRRSNQLSYEAADVGSWSHREVMGSRPA